MSKISGDTCWISYSKGYSMWESILGSRVLEPGIKGRRLLRPNPKPSTYTPPEVERKLIAKNHNQIRAYSIFYLLKGDYRQKGHLR